MKIYSKLFAILPIAITALFIWINFSEIILNANNFIYHSSGDTLKNYFHVALYAKYGNGFWLNEVNYPFGEHIIFLDNQPALSFILEKLNLHEYTIGIINILPFIGLLITSSFIFLIQRKLGLPLFFNVFSSVFIALLSPQVLRFESHHALAYSFFIPTLILFYLYLNKYKLLYFIASLFILICSFIHVYYLLIGMAVILSLGIVEFLSNRKQTKFIYLMLTALVPFLIFKLIISFTDPINDRPETPSGMVTYRSTFEGLFIPQKGKLGSFFMEELNFKAQNFESIAYLGKLGLPILIVMIFSVAFRFFKREKIIPLFHNQQLFYLSIASCLVWVFSMYYPFKFAIDFLGEYISAIKQFRSLGRLGWYFFYVFSILISFKLYHYFNLFKSSINIFLAIAFLIFSYFLWFSDITNNFINIENSFKANHTNIFKTNNYEKLGNDIEFEKFQASLALPFFHIGSEIRNYEGSNKSIKEVFKLAYFYQLPYFSTYSSRTSSSQLISLESIFERSNFNHIIENTKPILLVADKFNLNKQDSLLISRSTFLKEEEDILYYSFKP